MPDLTNIPLPAVARVHTERGSYIEPRLDRYDSDDERLAWHTAVTAADSFLPIRLYRGEGSATYGFTIRRSSIGQYSFREAWVFLTGVSVGARQAEAGGA